jgi:PAS domain S-box-containing protein
LWNGVIGEEVTMDTLKRVLRETDEHYRSFFENAAEGFFRSTPSGQFTEVNPALVRMLGYEFAEEVLALAVPDELYVDPPRRAPLWVQYEATRTREGVDLWWKKKDGSPLIVSLQVRAVLDAQAHVIGYEGMVLDITARKRAEEARQEETAMTVALARAGQELTALLDSPTILTRLCQLATEEVGCDASHAFLWQPQEMVYLPVAGWGDTPEQWEAMQVLKVPGEIFANLVACPASQEERQATTAAAQGLLTQDWLPQLGVTASLWVALWRGEELSGALSLEYRGRTEPFSPRQERLARGLAPLAVLALTNARLRQELTHANRLKSDFLAAMSHELHTPLNIIFGYTSFLLEGDFGPLTAEQNKMLEGVEKSARQLLELASATFEASQFERGRPALDRTEVKVTELMAELKRETERMQNESGLFFVWRVIPALPRLYTDRAKLKIILKNLLSNAVKFTPEGSVMVEVCAQGNGVEFRVTDTGVGIAPEVKPVIFELFHQGESSAARRYEGAGLGLYIVRQMIELLGGTVTVESEVGYGSTFRVWLPTILKGR